MRSVLLGVGSVAVALAVGLSGCGDSAGDSGTTGASATTIGISSTNFVTLAPTPSTTTPITSAEPLPGSILEYESTYVVQTDDYPSTVALKFKVDFQAFLDLNGWTFDGTYVPEWPGVGATIKIPAGATVPGEPAPGADTGSGDTGSGDESADASEATTGTTEAPTTTVNICTEGTYTIVEGDTPSGVAKKLDTTIDLLRAANADTKGYGSFYVGLVIKVPAKTQDC